jgi:hypothetical protein
MALMKRHATAESEYPLGIRVTADEQAVLVWCSNDADEQAAKQRK